MTTAILFFSHVWNAEIERQARNLPDTETMHRWLLIDASGADPGAPGGASWRRHIFTKDALFEGPYGRLAELGLIGHAHLPILHFFGSHPEYDYYWLVEYDVRYRGRWEDFFSSLEAAPQDFIAPHIRRYKDEPRWPWWRTFHHPSDSIPRKHWVRSFNVIYRISRRALEFLDAKFREGWLGHHEAAMVTLLHHAGFTLHDLSMPLNSPCTGGKGKRFCTSGSSFSGYLYPWGTIRHRPARLFTGWRRNMLYHPVKPRPMREGAGQRLREYWRSAREWAREFRWNTSGPQTWEVPLAAVCGAPGPDCSITVAGGALDRVGFTSDGDVEVFAGDRWFTFARDTLPLLLYLQQHPQSTAAVFYAAWNSEIATEDLSVFLTDLEKCGIVNLS